MSEGGGGADRPEGFRRVAAHLVQQRHAHAPLWLEVAARTAQEAADALGVALGQIAKSVVFRRKLDDAAVLVVTSGDRRVDERKVAALVGAIGRADADFVKARTGFTIGGVAPLAHSATAATTAATTSASASAPLLLIDRELFRFDAVWAAAGHPNGVFRASPAELVALTGAPVHDVVQGAAGAPSSTPSSTGVASPCNSVCRMNAPTGWCEGCGRTLDEIAAWATLDDAAKRSVWALLPARRAELEREGQR